MAEAQKHEYMSFYSRRRMCFMYVCQAPITDVNVCTQEKEITNQFLLSDVFCGGILN